MNIQASLGSPSLTIIISRGLTLCQAAGAMQYQEACRTSLLALARDVMGDIMDIRLHLHLDTVSGSAVTVVRLDYCRHLMSSFLWTLCWISG